MLAALAIVGQPPAPWLPGAAASCRPPLEQTQRAAKSGMRAHGEGEGVQRWQAWPAVAAPNACALQQVWGNKRGKPFRLPVDVPETREKFIKAIILCCSRASGVEVAVLSNYC